MTSQSPSYHGYRFPLEIISHAVWLYHLCFANILIAVRITSQTTYVAG
jgi:hypothetical protein